MELREFAERVLFATNLEDKLRPPEHITDEHPGPALAAPAAPGRPKNLHFKPSGSAKSDFPGLHQLENQIERGRLLHFFGNHELLATELMALVLLRFPDAPPAFRKGLLQTLKDEQLHTRWYMDRMAACGLEFGELPVSGYFWRCVSPMENPMDYVASLCLTFEQANLDFAGHFARGFAAVGDTGTAQLLGKIYQDEIGHVAYGLKWFRRWKHPGESDWDAFCRTLKFPLSPQRAKGFTLNLEGRRAAGLDPDFIAQLEVYSQSKGRTPNIYLFNPLAEAYIAGGKSFNPTRHQAQLAEDLENLPQFLGRQDDIVLVRRRPAVEFLSRLKQAGFALPEFVEYPAGARVHNPQHTPSPEPSIIRPLEPLCNCEPADDSPSPGGEGRPARRSFSVGGGEGGLVAPQPGGGGRILFPQGLASPPVQGFPALRTRKLGRLRPWAWGPDSVALLEPLFARVTGETRTPEQRSNPGLAELYSKAWSAAFLRHFLEQAGKTGPGASLLCGETEVGVAVNTVDEALAAIAAIRRRGHHKIVVKQALGVAGANALRLFEPELLDSQRRWLANALQGGTGFQPVSANGPSPNPRQLVVEPWLERVMDFSVQLEMTADGLKLCGYTGLLNDARGQFQGNWAEPHHHKRIPSRVIARFTEAADVSGLLLAHYANLFEMLAAELRRRDFTGPLGIDAFIYKDPTGKIRLKPVVEINPRFTMGRLTVELMKQVCQGGCGWFRLMNLARLRGEGVADFPAYARLLAERHPLQLAGEPAPKIRSGALCLNDPARAQVCLAVFQVT